MRREEVIAKLKEAEAALRARGVAALFLFGSHARHEAGQDSDIDVFVDPISGERFGLLPFMEAGDTIRDTLGHDVTIGYSTREGLDRYIPADVEEEAIRVL